MSSSVMGIALLGVVSWTSAALAQDQVDATSAEPQPEAQVFAEPPPPPPSSPFTLEVGPLPIEFHGYASQAYVLSQHNNHYNVESSGGSFHLTEVALNASSQVTDRTRVVLQMAALMNDVSASPSITLDFGFVDHRFDDAFGIRVGRFRMLSALYSEVWDTDIARLPVFMPSSIYDPQGRQYFMNAQGIQLYGALRSQHAGSVDYSASVGALEPFHLSTTDNEADLVAASRVIYTTPIDGLRIGGAGTFARVESTTDIGALATIGLIQAGMVPPTFNGTITSTIDHLWRWNAFAEYAHGGLTIAAEYSRLDFDLSVNDPSLAPLVPPLANNHNEDFYLMASYRFTDHFTAGGYASFHFEDYNKRSSTDPALHNYDYAGTLRFDLNAYLAFKAELHRIDGTAKLDTRINPNGPMADADWLFALRVSAAF